MDKCPKNTYDPGWNDPPTFSYDALKNPPKKGTLLNKRVAFPLSSNTQGTTSNRCSNPPAFIPPPNNSAPPPPITASVSSTVTDKDEDRRNTESGWDKEEIIHKVYSNFEEVVRNASESLKDNEEEIRKRVDILKKMVDEDKLPSPVYNQLLELSEALKQGKGDVADSIHVGLMVDHVSQCSQWMAGIRYLIHHVKSHQNLPEHSVEHRGSITES